MKYALVFLIVLSGLITPLAFADIGNVTYTPPTQREDNTPLLPSEIAGYKVYDQSGAEVLALPGDATSFTVPANGQTLFVTTLDTDGRESVFSQPVVIPSGKSNPKSPAGITVTISIGK